MTFLRNSLIAFVAITLVSAGYFGTPGKAEAVLPVIDAANIAVNTANGVTLGSLATSYQARKGPLGSGIGLDTIAWQLGKIAVQMMTKSVVNWINSGFNGSPAFVSNPQTFFQGIGDVAAGAFLNKIATDAGLKSPFQSQVVGALTTAYFLSTANNVNFSVNGYNLNRYSTNDAAFLRGNFSQGGWTAWYHAIMNPQNNPYGARIELGDELNAKVRIAQGNAQVQLNWGQGFLSWCGENSGDTSALTNQPIKDMTGTLTSSVPTINADGSVSAGTGSQTSVQIAGDPVNTSSNAQASNCLRSDGTMGTIKTPGSVIQNQINHTLGLTGDTLVTADEFNEVIGALMSQLVSNVLGSGLSSIGNTSSGGNGYIDQATNPSQITNATQSSDSNALTLTSVQSALTQVEQYQTDWNTISAEAKLADAGVNNLKIECIADLSTLSDIEKKAAAESARADAAVTALTKIQNDAHTATVGAGAGTGSTADLTNVSTEFQQFLASSAMPSAAELAYADAQVVDNSSDVETNKAKPTVYAFLSSIAAGNCPTEGPTLPSSTQPAAPVQGGAQ